MSRSTPSHPPAATDIDKLPDAARRVALLLRERGHDKSVVLLPETGKTSAEAAAGLGCSVAQIAKSILFRRREDDAPVLVVASGRRAIARKDATRRESRRKQHGKPVAEKRKPLVSHDERHNFLT